MLFLLNAFLLVVSVNAQDRTLQYKIMHKGDQVGAMVFYENTNGKNIHIKTESEVKATFILHFSVKTVEEAIFRDGILTYSSVYRKVNGDEQVNRCLQVNGVGYNAIDKDGYNTPPTYPVHFNILSLYYSKPVGITRNQHKRSLQPELSTLKLRL
ncbi:MAG TPA: DUF6134 family protein [Puia sp.]|jgi:hypothetical protein|nr:DUF6134 family protein [Puia sp.]